MELENDDDFSGGFDYYQSVLLGNNDFSISNHFPPGSAQSKILKEILKKRDDFKMKDRISVIRDSKIKKILGE